MLNIKTLIASLLLTGVAAVSFAATPVAVAAAPATTTATAVAAPADAAAKPVAKKNEEG